MTDYPEVLYRLYPGSQWSLAGESYGGLVWHDDSPKPSQAELDAAWAQVQYERDRAAVEQARRARYQAETDGMFFAAQREGGDLSAWQASVDAIKADLPYPDAPA